MALGLAASAGPAPAAIAEDASVAAPGIPEPPPEAVLADLPFEDAPPTRVFVNLAPEGSKPMVLMLDTGASDCVLTPGMARSLGISIRRTKSTPYRRATRLGRDLQFWIDTQSSDTASKTGFEYGLLGGSFLDDYVLEIDYPGRRVRFLDRKRYRLPEHTDASNERVLPFKRSGTRIFTEIEMGDRSERVLLDTGAPGTVLLSGRSARRLGIDVDSLPVLGEIGGVLGTTEVRFLETDHLRWAGFAFGATPVEVAPRGFYNQAGSTDSILGYDLLRQFTIRIDYRRKRLWLRRGADREMTFYGEPYEAVGPAPESGEPR